ncbi:hypothetical protein [Halorhabdus rudnickae]|uniref:hypothetical protein n=1 Tax=Halorhabdus rudnickae TaxID=1775544 RepID=UPI001082E982|nr:hypothetical protein [Halorhabdus rudnickae]
MTTPREIAADIREYLRSNSAVCAEGAAHGWRWLRFCAGEWRAVRYCSGDERRSSYVEGRVFDDDEALDWIESHPATLRPTAEAYRWDPAEQTVWEDACEQDVFSDFDRCFWCGGSDRDHDLQEYQTVEDGVCSLCDECHTAWADAGEIVSTAGKGRGAKA